MNPENKKYILDNIGKKSVREIAASLQLKEKVINRFLEKERGSEKQEKTNTRGSLDPKSNKANFANILAIIVIIVVGIVIYSNTLHSSFLFDDESRIVENISIRNLSNVGAIFNFNPTRFITYLSIALNYHFGKLDTFGYHIFNIIAHLCASIMVWWLIILTLRTPVLKNSKISLHADIIAFLGALIFVSHPIQTQAVSYIIQRASVLATLFYVASLAFYVRSRLSQYEEGKSGGLPYYTLSFIALVLAMFSKEMAITLPFIILLYELSFFKGEEVPGWKHVAPFFAALLIIPLTMVISRSVNFNEMRLVQEEMPGISPWHYLLTQIRVIPTYIRLLFFPANQNLDYDYAVSTTLFNIPVLSSLIFLSLILTFAVKIFSKYRLISFGILWFFITLLPESSMIPIRDVIYEHRLYLPMVGYAIFLVSTVYYLFENKGIKPVIAILSIVIVAASVLTYNRNFVWKDEFTLWNDAAIKSPHKARPYNNRGNAYLKKGDTDKAIADFDKSIKLDPALAFAAYNNRAAAYFYKGDLDKAMADFNSAISIDAKHCDAYNNLGAIYLKKGDLEKAIYNFNKAIEVNPRNVGAYRNLGGANLNKGNIDQAIYCYSKAIEIDPTYVDIYNALGIAYQEKGDLDQAIFEFDKIIKIDPKNAPAYCNRGNAYFKKGNMDQAILDFNKAMELDPKNAGTYIYGTRAEAYFRKQQYANSWEDLHRAQALGVRFNPEFIEALKKVSGREN